MFQSVGIYEQNDIKVPNQIKSTKLKKIFNRVINFVFFFYFLIS